MNYISEKEKNERFKALKAQTENQKCVDCGAKFPQWASASVGVFICMECSSKHRSLGPQTSFVRSIGMDNWTDREVLAMELGGNKRFKDFCRQNAVASVDYTSDLVRRYKRELEQTVGRKAGAEEPAAEPPRPPAPREEAFVAVEAPADGPAEPTAIRSGAKRGLGAKKLGEKINVGSLVADDLHLTPAPESAGPARLSVAQSQPASLPAAKPASGGTYKGVSSDAFEPAGSSGRRPDADAETPFMNFVHRAKNKFITQTGTLLDTLRDRLHK